MRNHEPQKELRALPDSARGKRLNEEMSNIRRKPDTSGTRRVTHLPSNPACRLDRQSPASSFHVTERTRNEVNAPNAISYRPPPLNHSRLGALDGWRTSTMHIPPPRRIRQNALLRKRPVGYRAPATSLLRSRRKLWKRDFLGVRLSTILETHEDSRFQEATTGPSGVKPLPSIWEAALFEKTRSTFWEIGQSPPPPPTPTIRDLPTFHLMSPCSSSGFDDGTDSSDVDLDAYEFEFDLHSRPSQWLDMTLPVAKFPMAKGNERVRNSCKALLQLLIMTQDSSISLHVAGHPEVDISSIYDSILRHSSQYCF